MQPPYSAPLRIETAGDAAALLAPTFEGAARERLAVLYLDAERVVLGLSETRLGGAARPTCRSRPIIADALRLGAASLILAHNHPHGDPMPSEADRAATRELVTVTTELGIRVQDHLIFAGSDFPQLPRPGAAVAVGASIRTGRAPRAGRRSAAPA
jgi:DNA repair protein RadC